MELQFSSFQLSNQADRPMLIFHEPEGFEFRIPPGEEVTVVVESVTDSVQLRWWVDKEDHGVNIMPGKSNFKVFYKGEDVFKDFL